MIFVKWRRSQVDWVVFLIGLIFCCLNKGVVSYAARSHAYAANELKYQRVDYEHALSMCGSVQEFGFHAPKTSPSSTDTLGTIAPVASTWIDCPSTMSVLSDEACVLDSANMVHKVDRKSLNLVTCAKDRRGTGVGPSSSAGSPPFLGLETLKEHLKATLLIGSLVMTWFAFSLYTLLEWRFVGWSEIYVPKKLNYVSMMSSHYMVLIFSGMYLIVEYLSVISTSVLGEGVGFTPSKWITFFRIGVRVILFWNMFVHVMSVALVGFGIPQSNIFCIRSLTDRQWLAFRCMFGLGPTLALLLVQGLLMFFGKKGIPVGTLNAAFHIFSFLLVFPIYWYSRLNRSTFDCLDGLIMKVSNDFWFNRLRIYCQSLFFYHIVGFLAPLIVFGLSSSETGHVLGLNVEPIALLLLVLFIEVYTFFSIRKCISTDHCVSYGDEETSIALKSTKNLQESQDPSKVNPRTPSDEYTKKDQDYFLLISQIDTPVSTYLRVQSTPSTPQSPKNGTTNNTPTASPTRPARHVPRLSPKAEGG